MTRGVNLGCGKVIMPCVQPAHHNLLPLEIYQATDTVWDNVDMHANAGVNLVADIFRYPWPLESDTYDVALASHILEHIPHGVIRHGQLESLVGGWWAWWEEVGRVLKPGGVIYCLVPYAFSLSGMSDPTHTRYLTHQTFGYFMPDPTAPFDYHLKYKWEVIYGIIMGFTDSIALQAMDEIPEAKQNAWMVDQSTHHLDVCREFAVGLRVLK